MTAAKKKISRSGLYSSDIRLIIANTINDLTYRELSPDKTSLIDLFAFQELWLIQPGDVIVTARPMPSDFVSIVCNTLGIDHRAFTCLCPQAHPEETLLSAIRRAGMLSELRTVAKSNPRLQIRACAMDRPLVELAAQIELPIEGYHCAPSTKLLEIVERLNTKSGFRDLCQSLDLRVAPGFSNVSAQGVRPAVDSILLKHDEAIVKSDRGSGGSGQFRVAKGTFEKATIHELDHFVDTKSRSAHSFVVEACLPLQLDPTIDVEISETGARCLYIGAMDCSNGTFSGMTVPAGALAGKRLEEFRHAADLIGAHLFQMGYRGFFDIDAGVTTAGELFLFEANVRRTSTSLWDSVLRRVLGDAYNEDIRWCLTTTTSPADDASGVPALTRGWHADANHSGAMTLMAWARSPQTSSFLRLDATFD